MSVAEMKLEVIKKITKLENEAVLQEVLTLLEKIQEKITCLKITMQSKRSTAMFCKSLLDKPYGPYLQAPVTHPKL